MSKIKHEFPSINHELFINFHLYTFSNMKRLFLSLLTGIAALCGSAQTKDSVDVSQFTVVYDYACKTRMGKTGENITDTMRLAVQVGTKLNRMMEYYWYDYFIHRHRKEDVLHGMWSHCVNMMPECIYTNYPEGKLTTREGVVPKPYETTQPMNTIQWQLSADTATIATYPCKKAVGEFGGRTWTVFYTDEVPSTAGPWKLHGCPGLIVRADDSEGIHHFELNALINEQLAIRYEPKPNYVRMDNAKFIKFRNGLFCNPRYVQDPHYWLSAGDNIQVQSYMWGPTDWVEYYNGIYSPHKDNVRYYQPLELK